jgi:hypothetical protein
MPRTARLDTPGLLHHIMRGEDKGQRRKDKGKWGFTTCGRSGEILSEKELLLAMFRLDIKN